MFDRYSALSWHALDLVRRIKSAPFRPPGTFPRSCGGRESIEETRDATSVVGFLVGGEQECGGAIAGGSRSKQCSRRALDVARAQTHGAFAIHAQLERARAPMRRIRHRIEMHVEQQLRRASHGVETDGAGAVIDDRAVEPAQVLAQIIEHATRADRAWRIARIERDERVQMRKRRGKQFAHALPRCSFSRLTSAYSVELMPYKRMKPSASATPQSAACAYVAFAVCRICGDFTSIAYTLPPRVSIVTVPVTMRCVEARNASRIVFQRIVIEAFVDELSPLAADLGLEAVLLLGQHRLFERRCATISAVRPGASNTMRPLRPIVVSPVYRLRPTP